MVAALDLGSSVLRRVGSSPVVRTKPVRVLTGFFVLSGINLKTLYLSGMLSMNKNRERL